MLGKPKVCCYFHVFINQFINSSIHHTGDVVTPHGIVRAMKCQNRIANSRFDVLQFSPNRLDDLFDENGNDCGKMKTRVKQVLPTHVEEIRLNHLDTHGVSEHSSVSRYNFNNGTIKKIDRHVEERKN